MEQLMSGLHLMELVKTEVFSCFGELKHIATSRGEFKTHLQSMKPKLHSLLCL